HPAQARRLPQPALPDRLPARRRHTEGRFPMTAPTVPDDLWKRLTSTVGLVSVRCGAITNVMAAEWSYFVNKAPLYAAVVLGPRAATGALIAEAGEFALTLCSEDQAELADFAGAFSVADVDKTGSELIEFGAPRAIGS